MRALPAPTPAATVPGPPVAPDQTPAPAVSPVPSSWRARAIMDDPTTAAVLHSVWSGDAAILAPAPPGSGKSRLVALLAATLADRAGLRVAVAAQTRDQALALANRLGDLTDRASLMWARNAPRPAGLTATNVACGPVGRFPTNHGGVIVATTAKWLTGNAAHVSADVMLVDEAWQCTFGDLGALGAFAGQVAAVGDPGQIAPVVTGATGRWEESPSGPHRPGPDALLAAYGDAVSVVRLRHTYRLGPETTALIQPFYPGLPFTSRRPPEHVTLDGTCLPELATLDVPVTAGPTDPALMHALADRARALLAGTLTTTEGTRPMTPADLTVVCPHVAQAAAVRALLADLPDVLVGTTNALQGMERPAAVVAHPLAGYRDPTAFGTDPGRACVMLTRHRAHLSLLTDPTTPAVLDAADPTPDTETHRRLWESLRLTD